MSTSDEQENIFKRFSLFLDADILGKVTHLRACNSELLMVISDQKVVHISAQNEKYRRTDIKLPVLANSEDRVAYLHLDFGGTHALVSTKAGENIYVNVPKHTSKGLPELQGKVISAVGWNIEYSGRDVTGFIVLGTMTGHLWGTRLTSSGDLSDVRELVPDVLVSKEKQPIDSIHWLRCPDTTQELLLFTTASRLYILKGPAIPPVPASTSSASHWNTGDALNATYCSLFNEEVVDQLRTLSEYGGGDKNQASQLAVYPQSIGKPPQKYAWLASGGIRMGAIKLTDAYEAFDIGATLPHERVDGRLDYPLDYPLDLALTEHHALLLYSDRLVTISMLNRVITFKYQLGEEFGVVRGMSRDPISGSVWVYTSTGILQYRPTIKMHGTNSVVDRSLVGDAGIDDLGRGEGDKKEESLKTGNAGACSASAVGAWAEPEKKKKK